MKNRFRSAQLTRSKRFETRRIKPYTADQLKRAKRLIQLLLPLLAVAVPAPSLFAQGVQPPSNPPAINLQTEPEHTFSFVNVGLFAGRSGAANGPSGLVEFDPVRWFGVGLFASESSGGANMYGGRASSWSFSAGLLFTVHPRPVKKFLISPFAQVGFNHDHGRLIIPEGQGIYFRDGDDPENYTWTVGPSIERPLFKNGPRWSIRFGRNFGPVTAAQHGGGIYAVAGFVLPLGHPVALVKSFGHL